MAIFKPGAGYTAPVVKTGLMFTNGAQGQPVAMQATTNRIRPTPQFSDLDQLIRSLDADYDALEDKSEWVAMAANIDGSWQLCANCMPDSGPKKLFRMYNFNRQLMGLPLASMPVDPTEVPFYESLNCAGVFTGTPGTPFVILGPTPPYAGALYVIPQGYALNNPKWIGDLSQFDTPLTGGTFYDFFIEVVTNANGGSFPTASFGADLPMCCGTATGLPTLKSVLTVSVTV